jgi:hypothetical protein
MATLQNTYSNIETADNSDWDSQYSDYESQGYEAPATGEGVQQLSGGYADYASEGVKSSGGGSQQNQGYTVHNQQYEGQAAGTPHSAANYPASNHDWAPLYGQEEQGTKKPTYKSGATSQGQTTSGETRSHTEYSGKAPTFDAPVYDEKEVRKRARRLAAPALRQLEHKMISEMSRYYENPNVRRMVTRDALAGYGIGLGNIMAQSENTAQQQYGAEHARLYTEAMEGFKVAWQKYISTGTQVSTTDQKQTTGPTSSYTVIPRAKAAQGKY